MTCDECEAIVIDIARGRGDVDRALRDDARRHATLCSRCGEQWQEQEWLTAQLRAIATSDVAPKAAERIESAVLGAWRAEYGSVAAVVNAAGRGAPRLRARAPFTVRWMFPGVVLGGLAVAAMAMVFVWPSTRGGSQRSATGSTSATSMGVSARTANGASVAGTSRTPGTDARLGRNSQSKDDSVPVARAEAPAAAIAPATMRPRETTSARVQTVLARAAMRSETEFQPLPYVEPLRSTEARQVIRVSMTGGDEVILGMLPSDHRNGQPFEADVLVGEDGIARAIRIVH
jgi:hypothetical protein